MPLASGIVRGAFHRRRDICASQGLSPAVMVIWANTGLSVWIRPRAAATTSLNAVSIPKAVSMNKGLFVSWVVALAIGDVKTFERDENRFLVLLCMLLSQHKSHIDVFDAASHHDVRENLDDAPQAIEVCRAVQDEEAAAPCQRDWQATQICLDIVLVDAEFVKPHARLTLMLGPKAPPPLLQGFPLRSRVVVPGVRDERIAMTELGGLCQSVKAWIRGIVLHILESQLGDVDTAEALPSLLQSKVRRQLCEPV
eukprot:CAMPEP_0115746166 /NCGR_PEP_ID=MMETSP0272-20121206/92494_1 /TAXON_ID=71861 /ORGANISM="Scrippsiella trochoidea, Strain CCMP3099" /LENGTH=253 /DNA_ID=CAMNT_0003191093 /DNA_START=346 /DNA_END=1108 /DNA_ORIENTATION=+